MFFRTDFGKQPLGHAQLPPLDGREDDEICETIRSLQSQLKQQIKINNGLKVRFFCFLVLTISDYVNRLSCVLWLKREWNSKARRSLQNRNGPPRLQSTKLSWQQRKRGNKIANTFCM
jgi:hypothetical protein